MRLLALLGPLLAADMLGRRGELVVVRTAESGEAEKENSGEREHSTSFLSWRSMLATGDSHVVNELSKR